ncbi:MAG: class I mannose-6-phosphate isomerase [Oscillospiraceae bacterium]|nr:class I mannose-6-phosphate isomerase [Oscillospiraceae bacterium]
MYPLKLTPTFKDYIWGGTRLKTDFDKKTDLEKVAESWELSCHKDGPCVIANGCYQGLTLEEYIVKQGKRVLGSNCERFENFPILIKLIDARDNLSVQVHPDNEYALRVEGEYGKTEMWYIVDCEPGASLLYGFDHEISKEEFAERIQNNTLLEVTNRVPVKKGDVFFIEAGTLHAIGSGILIAEIQQNSNTTYRIYDYGRVGNDGKPRELHVEKAKEVTALCPPAREPVPEGKPYEQDGATKTLLASCSYFTTEAVTVEDEATFVADEKTFQSLLILEGEAVLTSDGNDEVTARKGESIFIPAEMGSYTVKGKCELLFTTV